METPTVVFIILLVISVYYNLKNYDYKESYERAIKEKEKLEKEVKANRDLIIRLTSRSEEDEPKKRDTHRYNPNK